ncbi:hypothetical protein CEXT_503951 [Caerostris extrusa]|uniref:Uncharacterized protein n=1 Tax=Caerostris extrusa TaxID=172846 RepID=A0AAV4Y393_CAEEX|nr:hypothetical protein CEXT_503951 [Caerostris extrusa]
MGILSLISVISASTKLLEAETKTFLLKSNFRLKIFPVQRRRSHKIPDKTLQKKTTTSQPGALHFSELVLQ